MSQQGKPANQALKFVEAAQVILNLDTQVVDERQCGLGPLGASQLKTAHVSRTNGRLSDLQKFVPILVSVAIFFLGRSVEAAAEDARTAAAGSVVAQLVEAMRGHDDETFVTLVALPFVVDGFDMATGGEREKCAALAESQSKAHTLRFHAKDFESVRNIAGCLSLDNLLLDALPNSGAPSWPVRLPKDAASKTAALSKIATKRVPRVFRRHANELKALSVGSQFFHLTVTDNNGITADVAFAVTTQESPRVAAMFIHTRFQE